MELDPETAREIRAILARDCVVEVTVTFFDESTKEPLEAVDVGTSLQLAAGDSAEEKRAEVEALIGSLGELLRRVMD